MEAKYIVEFCIGVESLRNFKKANFLMCVMAKTIGDCRVRMVVNNFDEISKIHFKQYHDNRIQALECEGGLQVNRWYGKDIDSWKGDNNFDEICEEFLIK